MKIILPFCTNLCDNVSAAIAGCYITTENKCFCSFKNETVKSCYIGCPGYTVVLNNN